MDKHYDLLNSLSRHLADGTEFGSLAAQCVQSVGEFFGYPVAEIWVTEAGRRLIRLKDANKVPERDLGMTDPNPEAGIFHEALRRGRTIHVPDTTREPLHIPRFDGILEVLSVPIRVRGTAQGVLHLEWDGRQAVQPHDVSVFESATGMLAGAIYNQQLYEQTKLSEEYLYAVLKAAQDIAIISTDRHGYIITCSEGTERIFGCHPMELRGRDILTLYADESLVRGLHDFVTGSSRDEIFKKDITELRRGDEHLYLNLRFQKVRNLHSNIIGFLGITRDISETVELERRLREMSVTDELTGLYNQREFFNLLEKEVEKYRRNRRPLSLCFFDLDKFKQFNDTRGHLEGDQVLKKVAEFIRKSIRQPLDLACRYGGDEFTIIMSEVSTDRGSYIAERVRTTVQEYFKGGITLSMGITAYDPRWTTAQFVEAADKAMYQAKSRGGNRVAIY